MKILTIILFILVGLIACNPKKTSKQNQISNTLLKSRIDLVNELPYRNMGISSTVENEIVEDILLILPLIDTSESFQMFWKSWKDSIQEEKVKCRSFKQLINYSYNFWKEEEVNYTCIAYPSSSEYAITGDIDSFYVFEIEHKALTGTVRIFFKSLEDSDSIEISYQERN
jgi:hypothetical protein